MGPVESVEERIARIATISVGELRTLWQEVFSSEPPSAFSNYLLARAIAYRLSAANPRTQAPHSCLLAS